MLMADYGVNLYGNAIMVNPKFAAEKPDAVKGFLRAFVKGLQGHGEGPGHRGRLGDQAQRRRQEGRSSSSACSMALKDNIVTAEVKANGYGGVDKDRLAKSIDQIALTYEFKNAKPKAADVFDASFLPPAADRKAN